MKKILSLLLFTLFSLGVVNAQSSSNVRFGLSLNPSINWLSAQNKNKFETKGSTFGFGGGLNVEVKLSQTASLTTGINFTTQGGNTQYTDSAFYQYENSELQELDNPSSTDFTNILLERETKINYVNLPVGVKLKTPEFGLITYYGEFGVNFSFRTNSTTTDKTIDLTSLEEKELSNIVNTDDTQLFNMGFNFGAGLEYNLAGSTSLFFTVKYNNNFINLNSNPSNFLYEKKDDGNFQSLKQTINNQSVIFAVGVFF